MKNNLHLITSVDNTDMLEMIIEQLATRRYDSDYVNLSVPVSWQAIDTSSVEIYMSGKMEFDHNEKERIVIPYITSFLFSCTREKNKAYDLMWSISLS